MTEPGNKIRAMVVDDSAVMRSLLKMALESSPEIEPVGVAVDGMEALEAMERLRPDLVLLDIEMPRMNGLEVLAQMRARNLPGKVIMCSTLTRRGAGITLEALASGASDYVSKPAAQSGVRESLETLSRELLPKIHALFPAHASQPQAPRPYCISARAPNTGPEAPGAVVIGVSTGGPAALEKLLPVLPARFPLPVLIVQHMPPLFTALLAERLNTLCKVPVHEAVSGEAIQPGHIYLARGDWHMQVVGSAARCALRITQAAPEQSCRPSVDVLFRSAAAVYGAGTLAVVLTGMGADGLDGCRAVHAAGGRILVQDRKTSVVWGMPGIVADAGLAEQVLPLEKLAEHVIRFATQDRGKSDGLHGS